MTHSTQNRYDEHKMSKVFGYMEALHFAKCGLFTVEEVEKAKFSDDGLIASNGIFNFFLSKHIDAVAR